MNQPSSKSDLIAKFVTGTPDRSIDGVVEGLRSGRITAESSPVGVARLPGVSTEVATRAAELFSEIPREFDPEILADHLEISKSVRSIERLGSPDVQIVWTGPESTGTLVRPTASVIDEMLSKVRDSGEILLVGYSLTAPAGSAMEKVIAQLEDATRRGAQLTLILHSDEEETNLSNLMNIWNVFVRKPTVYTWNPDASDGYTSLHAKCLVVDRLDALVTSANFTFHGLESNLELGLRIIGGQAGTIFERFESLIAHGILTEWNPTST